MQHIPPYAQIHEQPHIENLNEVRFRITGIRSKTILYVALAALGSASTLLASQGLLIAAPIFLGGLALRKGLKAYGDSQFLSQNPQINTADKVNAFMRSFFWDSIIPGICLASGVSLAFGTACATGILEVGIGVGALRIAIGSAILGAMMGLAYFMAGNSNHRFTVSEFSQHRIDDLSFLANYIQALPNPAVTGRLILDHYRNHYFPRGFCPLSRSRLEDKDLLSLHALFQPKDHEIALIEYYKTLPFETILNGVSNSFRLCFQAQTPDKRNTLQNQLQPHLQAINALDLTVDQRERLTKLIDETSKRLKMTRPKPLYSFQKESRDSSFLRPLMTGISSRTVAGIALTILFGSACLISSYSIFAGLAISALSFSTSKLLEISARRSFCSLDPQQNSALKAESVARLLFWSNVAWSIGIVSATFSLFNLIHSAFCIESYAELLLDYLICIINSHNLTAFTSYTFFDPLASVVSAEQPFKNFNFVLKTLSSLHENLKKTGPEQQEIAPFLFNLCKRSFVNFRDRKTFLFPIPLNKRVLKRVLDLRKRVLSLTVVQGPTLEDLFCLIKEEQQKHPHISLTTYLKMIPFELFAKANENSQRIRIDGFHNCQADKEILYTHLKEVPAFEDEQTQSAWLQIQRDVQERQKPTTTTQDDLSTMMKNRTATRRERQLALI